MAIVTTGAVLLRSHPYSETSLVLRFFTELMGVVGVMAKGSRRGGSRTGSWFETFAGGPLTLYVKDGRELQTLRDFSPTRPRRGLARNLIRFGGASAVAELVLRHGGEAPAPALFAVLEDALDGIDRTSDSDALSTVLAAGWGVVAVLGYHPLLECCVACDRTIDAHEVGRFDLEAGGIRCEPCSVGRSGPRVGPGARRQLRGLLSNEAGLLTRPRAHLQLLSDFVTYHVSGGRPLESFRFLASLLPSDPEEP